MSFFVGKHVNLLESLIRLLRHITREGTRAKRLLVLVDSRVAFGVVSKVRSSARESNCLLRKTGLWCLAYDVRLDLVWMPTWANPTDAPHGATRPALSELDLLLEPLSVAALSAGEHVCKLESSGAFRCSKRNPAHAKNETSQVIYAGESKSTTSNVWQLPRRGCQKRMEK